MKWRLTPTHFVWMSHDSYFSIGALFSFSFPCNAIGAGLVQPMVERQVQASHKIVAKNLQKSFKGRQVVRGVSVELLGGEVVGLLGPNGAGKTTIFDMVVGLCQPDQGNIFLNQVEITNLPMYKRARRGIGYLPQEASIFRRLSVEDNVLAVLETLNLSTARRKTRLDELLEELNLTRLRTHGSYTLSGGERRRLEITRALATNPKFLLLDEPFAGIDPIAVGDIQDILTNLKKKGIGILITDHNVQDTLSITDRAYIISEGMILESGAPELIVNSPKARAVYLGERFKMSQ
jgi:lipopolysaccharide export system ATP-binding protein